MTLVKDITQLADYEAACMEMLELIRKEYDRLTQVSCERSVHKGGQIFDGKTMHCDDAKKQLDLLIVGLEKDLVLTRYTLDVLRSVSGRKKRRILVIEEHDEILMDEFLNVTSMLP